MYSNPSNILERNKQKHTNVRIVSDEFNKPIFLNLFYLNRAGLKLNSKSVKFSKNEWVQNPQLFCRDYYGEYEYYRIILLINNIKSVFLFDSVNLINNVILAPTENEIFKSINLI